jgi:hypothetical protein
VQCSVRLAQALAQLIDDQSYWILGLIGKKLPTIKEGLRIEKKSANHSLIPKLSIPSR